MITASQILESLLSILEARVVFNASAIEEYLTQWKKYSNHEPRTVQWIETRLRKYILNDLTTAVRIYKKDVTKEGLAETPTYVIKAFEKGEPVYHITIRPEFYNQIRHVIDYFKSDDAPQGQLHGISVEDAIRKSEEWNKILAKRAVDTETEEDYKVIHKDGGFTWVELLTEKALSKETHYMDHCVGDPKMGYLKAIQGGDCQIISLRDPSNKPHVTIEYNLHEHSIEQVSGHGNQPVVSRYLPLCYKFINEILKPRNADGYAMVNLRALFNGRKIVKANFADLVDMLDAEYITDEQFKELLAEGKQEGTLNDLSRERGYSALHVLLNNCQDMTPVIERLLNAGANVNIVDKDKVNPLFIAIQTVEEWDSTAVFDLLLKRGADANAKGAGGDPIIFYVIRQVEDDERREDMVDSLIRIGKADMNVRESTNGYTPLMAAMLWNHREDKYGEYRGYDEDTVSTILSYGKSDVTLKDKYGYDALCHAVGVNARGLIYELIRGGVDPNQEYSDKSTPLEYAIEMGSMDCAWELLKYRIKPEILQRCLDHCGEHYCDPEFEKELKELLGIEDDEEEE